MTLSLRLGQLLGAACVTLSLRLGQLLRAVCVEKTRRFPEQPLSSVDEKVRQAAECVRPHPLGYGLGPEQLRPLGNKNLRRVRVLGEGGHSRFGLVGLYLRAGGSARR